MPTPCPFCQIAPERILAQNPHAFAIRDAFPVSPGHTLIIPHRHTGSFFDTTPEEQHALLALLDGMRSTVPDADSWNIGINDGPTAGQTVPHLHIHLIPRYEGDVEDPRGGVRWVVPEKARYWD